MGKEINNTCPRCLVTLLPQRHKEITLKLLEKNYYFTEWLRCPKCNFIRLVDSNKVYRKSEEWYNELNKLKNKQQTLL